MKKIVFTLVLMISITALAQTGHRNGMREMTPEQIADLQTKKMTLALDLTEAQQAQIRKLNLENANLRNNKIRERNAKKESGERKALTSEERYALKTARLDHQIAQKKELQKILSKEQFEKWERTRGDKTSHRKGKRKGHHRTSKKSETKKQ